MSAPVVRFAPSPTGRIHLGNARTALLNYLTAQRGGGIFILRFDDTDSARSRQEYADSIALDLAWLGITPHRQAKQSERLSLYEAAVDRLKAMGLLYRAYETSAELERRRKLQQARGLPPVYDRAALKLTQEECARLEAEGRKPHWRFKLEPKIVAWDDVIRGPSHIDCSSLSDPILVREDGSFLYTLPSVADDIDMGVTHVVRGEDHVANTAVQIQIFEALAGKAPIFAHHNLLVDASGGGLSKRTGALSLSSLRENGVEPMAVAALAVLTGSSDEVRPIASLEELAQIFDLSHISRNPAKFDPNELRALSARVLHASSYQAVKARLVEAGADLGDKFWNAVRGNLSCFDDVKIWRDVIGGDIEPTIENVEFCAQAAKLLAPEPWDESTWSAWTHAVKQATGAKGKALFHPLRLALTGQEQGPEMAKLLPLIGRAKTLSRLQGL